LAPILSAPWTRPRNPPGLQGPPETGGAVAIGCSVEKHRRFCPAALTGQNLGTSSPPPNAMT
jgi:hypothetical protein